MGKMLLLLCMVSLGLISGNSVIPPHGNTSSRSECSCGIPKNDWKTNYRIFGGNTVPDQAKYPWHVAIKRNFYFVCSGALISRKYVLTAAKCFFTSYGTRIPDYKLNVGVGVHLLVDDKFASYYKISEPGVFIHPLYTSTGNANDVALIRLKNDVPADTMPLCLPQINDAFLGQEGIVTGWGKLKKFGNKHIALQEVKLQTLNSCENEKDTSTAFCTGKNPRKDICQGDLGNPLMMERDGKMTLVGIAIDDQHCGVDDMHSKFTYVPYFVQWVKDQIGNSAECL